MDYSGVLIKSEDKKILYQLRDEGSNTRNKNKWGIFGGGINLGEKPIDAAMRELEEELCIKAKKRNLKKIATVPQLFKRSHIFLYHVKKKDFNPKLKEGKSMEFMHRNELLSKDNVVGGLRLFILYGHLFDKRLKKVFK